MSRVNEAINFARDENGITLLAIFLSQLVREGVTYEITDCQDCICVYLTGGF